MMPRPIHLGRRVAWLAAGHPAAVILAAAGATMGGHLGWSLRRVLLAAIGADVAIGILVARSGTTPARLLTLWTMACRFRRRWPSLAMRSGLMGDRRLSIDEHGRRDHLAGRGNSGDSPIRVQPPSLRLLPRLSLPATVAWDLTSEWDPTTVTGWLPAKVSGPRPVGPIDDADVLATVDGRILRARLAHRHQSALVIEFADGRPLGPSGRPKDGFQESKIYSPIGLPLELASHQTEG